MRRYNEGHEFLIKKDMIKQEYIDRGLFTFHVRVADFLGELLGGLYKLPDDNFERSRYLSRIDPHMTKVLLPNVNLSTYDGDFLFKLVFLSYGFGVRCEIVQNNDGDLEMIIMDAATPTFEDKLAQYRSRYPSEASND
jgi:hypothetical protein